ncbi:MAG: hypothetical protein WC645_08485 [Candidatus Margulisiibacteriota bacterium]
MLWITFLIPALWANPPDNEGPAGAQVTTDQQAADQQAAADGRTGQPASGQPAPAAAGQAPATPFWQRAWVNWTWKGLLALLGLFVIWVAWLTKNSNDPPGRFFSLKEAIPATVIGAAMLAPLGLALYQLLL